MRLDLTEYTKQKLLESHLLEFDSISMNIVSIRPESVTVNVRIRLGNICVAEKTDVVLHHDGTVTLELDGPHTMEIELQ
ncbi:MAG: hypothetical protein ACXAEN_22935 [Candidatus Thorarchaeota archaeon]|jgi:hypothetical protein